MRHLERRTPRPNGAFCWGRVPCAGGDDIAYRLFRRSSVTGRTFLEARTFYSNTHRAEIARAVWRMRIALREAVDAVDLSLMGITEKAA